MSNATLHSLAARRTLNGMHEKSGADKLELLERVIAEPTPTNWANAYSIIVGGGMFTLWLAVLETDSSFPSAFPRNGWDVCPGREVILAALEVAAHRTQRYA